MKIDNKAKQQTKFGICSLIREMLLSDESLKEKVQNKVYPIEAPEDTEGSYIAYQRDEYSINRTKQGIWNQECIVYIYIVSPDYDESNEIADLVFKCLDGRFNVNNETQSIREIQMTDSTEDKVNDKFIQTLQFEIK